MNIIIFYAFCVLNKFKRRRARRSLVLSQLFPKQADRRSGSKKSDLRELLPFQDIVKSRESWRVNDWVRRARQLAGNASWKGANSTVMPKRRTGNLAEIHLRVPSISAQDCNCISLFLFVCLIVFCLSQSLSVCLSVWLPLKIQALDLRHPWKCRKAKFGVWLPLSLSVCLSLWNFTDLHLSYFADFVCCEKSDINSLFLN